MLSSVPNAAIQTAASSPGTKPAAARDPGVIALAMLASYHQVSFEPEQLLHELGLGTERSTAADLVRGARFIKLKARVLTAQDVSRLKTIPLPAILELAEGNFVILARRLDGGIFRIVHPTTQQVGHLGEAELIAQWCKTIVLVTKSAGIAKSLKPFGLDWFLPSIWRYRKPLGNVLIASFFIQLCGLITPIFFQITIDKVLVHKGYSTLSLVTGGLVVLGLFHVGLQYLRSYVLSHTTSRIDVELGARLFDHLLRLPLGYFESRAAGQTVARVRELETIRAFLTGQGLLSALDIVFAFLFIIILFLYSQTLATIVLISIPCYVLVAVLFRPVLREKTIDRFSASAISNQFLIECVVGIQTIKAMAVEPLLRKEWEHKLAAYVRTSFGVATLASLGQNLIQYINKLSTALVLFFGAYAVIEGNMTVGSLVAFNMIMGQISGPILRLSQLWQDFQQVRISVERLGDILDSPTESQSMSRAHLPPAKGAISVKNVVFRYNAGGAEVLKDVSIDIPMGQVIGIVGPSGSGKSTFTKLLQRLYKPEAGQILIDGIDIAQVDPAWLRRQVGVVLQENLLFNKTVHENIAFANPGMSRGQVMMVARLAGADEFINELPLGYDTQIEERGSNLSGGQRQRLAIARALATNPRILIFDEATSALDYESERVIQDNMRHIVKHRTVIIIAHRLAAVRACDRLIAIEGGRIVEDGTHQELLRRQNGLYGRLWRMQSGENAA